MKLTLRILMSVVVLTAIGFTVHKVRIASRSKLTATETQRQHSKNVRILRDRWGVPHIFGKTDSDSAFGLAYVQCEDQWKWLHGVMAAIQGKLGLIQLSTNALKNDYYVHWLQTLSEATNQYKQLSPEVRRVLEGYADGVNYFAALHPEKADSRLFPVTGIHVAAGFLHKLPLFEGLPRSIEEAELHSGKSTQTSWLDATFNGSLIGSNAHAVHHRRSKDGVTRLNINSHQPWEGPVTWYEAHVHSQEGWNILGATFVGGPFLLVGHNETLGWAHTVNRPKLVDIFELKTDGKALNYEIDAEWVPFERKSVNLELDIGVLSLPIPRTILHSRFGPVLEKNGRHYAFRYAGMGKLIGAIEQWYRMNRARNFTEWKSAMKLHSLPMMNTVYADHKNIYYIYNALLPKRSSDFSWEKFSPGLSSQQIWTDYLPYEELPSVTNPGSGFVQNCNSSPFHTTLGTENPKRTSYAPEFGIENRMTNRAVRTLEYFEKTGKIGMAEFLEMKFDRVYSKNSALYKETVGELLTHFVPKTQLERQGIALLKAWDGSVDAHLKHVTLPALTIFPFGRERELGSGRKTIHPEKSFSEALDFLTKYHGSLEVPWGDVLRLQRGSLSLPLSGAPDLLHAVYAKQNGKHWIADNGDSYVLVVEFGKNTVNSLAIHQYGVSEDPSSLHYADQAPGFSKRTLRKSLFKEEDIRAQLSVEYHPGENPIFVKSPSSFLPNGDFVN